MKVSIIIPVVAVNNYIEESIRAILALDWPDFEVLIFTDEGDKIHQWPKTRIISSGRVGPAEKRDLALKYATGEILAFLDDDAYPKRNWLKRSMPHFDNPEIAAVGGPAITPAEDDLLQKISGAVFESFLGGSSTRNRYLSVGRRARAVDDWPSVNLLVRKTVFNKVGGFSCSYYPGEDTKLCLDIIKLGLKIVYEPKAVVYHHRRSSLLRHFKQIGDYAIHRGFFAKSYPETSFRAVYFVPLLFDLYLILLAVLLVKAGRSPFTIFFAIPLALYFWGLIFDSVIVALRWRSPLIGISVAPMVLLTHIWYGLKFVQGLLITNLKR